jgi:hypothetical protein
LAHVVSKWSDGTTVAANIQKKKQQQQQQKETKSTQ